MTALRPACATIIGVIILAQIPSATEIAGVTLVIAGIGLHHPADQATRGTQASGNAYPSPIPKEHFRGKIDPGQPARVRRSAAP